MGTVMSLVPIALADEPCGSPSDATAHSGVSNGMDLLLFSLGTSETFGINVFKVREVLLTPRITPTPHMACGVKGVTSLRGSVIPVLDLARCMSLDEAGVERCGTLMVTEFCGRMQGFLVHEVDRITRVEWHDVKPPSAALTGPDGMVTGVARLPQGRLVSILDVEQILVNAFGAERGATIEALAEPAELDVFFVDDSATARREIANVLEKLGVNYQQAANGREAWEKLQALAEQAHAEGATLNKRLRLVLADAEMPEMDGYVLARHIREDRRFAGIPVVMHTSLSARVSRTMGESIGVDAFITKFDAANLAATLRPLLRPAPPHSNPFDAPLSNRG